MSHFFGYLFVKHWPLIPCFNLLKRVMVLLRYTRHVQSTPDLIILDIMMPQMDGLQVCRLLRSDPAFQAIPILLVSARGSPDTQEAGRDAGANGFVRKPFEENELVGLVHQALKFGSAWME